MKNLLLLLLFLLIHYQGVAQQTKKLQWSYSVGLGTAVAPTYLGDDTYQLLIFPNFSASHGDKFSVSLLDGARYNLMKTDTWRIGAVIKPNIGRFEDGSVPSSVSNIKTNDLVGLGDVGFTTEPGFFLEYTKKSLANKLEVRQGIGGHTGWIGELRSEYKNAFKLNKSNIYYSVGPEIRISSSNFNNAFFGIDQEQSLNTDLEAYEAKPGLLSYGLSGTVIVPLNKRFAYIAFVRYNKLGDVASDSPLIRQEGSAHQRTMAFMLNYTF